MRSLRRVGIVASDQGKRWLILIATNIVSDRIHAATAHCSSDRKRGSWPVAYMRRASSLRTSVLARYTYQRIAPAIGHSARTIPRPVTIGTEGAADGSVIP